MSGVMVPDWAGYARFRERLAAALDPAFHPIAHLDALVLSGSAQVWIEGDAILVTELRAYPGGAKAIHGLVAAGDLSTLTDNLIPMAEHWGRDLGCSVAEIESRQGWARTMKRHGYDPHQLTLRKALSWD